jgi:hypothetical protein
MGIVGRNRVTLDDEEQRQVGEAMEQERLWGFDDESVLYRSADGRGGCVQDEPELLEAILELCRNYFAPNQETPSE